jgi:hypothetical protein
VPDSCRPLPRPHGRQFRALIAGALLSAVPARGAAQVLPQRTAPSAAPSCAERVDSLARRIETDYAGFRLEVTGARRQQYDRFRRTLAAAAAGATGDGCLPVLIRLTRWFGDPHLFVFQSGRADTAEARRHAAAVAPVALDEARARAYFARRGTRLDPVEGIWYDAGLRVAIVPAPGGPRGRFVAVVLTPDTAAWRPGAVRARFTRRDDGGYDAEVWQRNYARRAHLDARVHKRVLLRMSPGIWGKAYPVAPGDSGLLDPTDPHRATVVVRGGAVVVSVPSHDPTYRRALDSVLAAHADALRGAERLLVDLRGNEGGSSWLTDGLLPYVASARRRPAPFDVDAPAAMLSSADQLAYAARAFGPDTTPFVRSLLARLRAHPGELVPLRDPALPPEPDAPDSVVVGPRRVGVLVDGGTVSAAEVLVLRALRSERARVFGEPTAGALDYQSVNVVPFDARERRWYLGYPTIAAHAALPTGGMRGRGIAPDVRVDWARVADPIAYVDRALRTAAW